MANNSYTYSQVLGGTGSFNKNGDTGFSQGVSDMQTHLKSIGYTISDAAGRFQTQTNNAVIEFQRELGISQDGDAGKNTLVRLDAARVSTYYKDYGKRLENKDWGRDNILAGKIKDIDLLARIIYAEHTNSSNDQNGVSIVIKLRSGNTAYQDPTGSGSKWAKVVGMYTTAIGPQYGTAVAGKMDAQKPMRGYTGTAVTGFVDPYWKNAVDRATNLVNGTSFSFVGYAVTGKTPSSSTTTIYPTTTVKYLNQFSWKDYTAWYDKGSVDTTITPLTSKNTTPYGNVIFKSK